ncbi:hypothetical protein ABVT39_011007 [Epinephelus coioides]
MHPRFTALINTLELKTMRLGIGSVKLRLDSPTPGGLDKEERMEGWRSIGSPQTQRERRNVRAESRRRKRQRGDVCIPLKIDLLGVREG